MKSTTKTDTPTPAGQAGSRADIKKRLAPRRQPNQSRAKDTVKAVLSAAGEAIEHEGLERLTTKRIADAAGISVGTLYEYFPNKQAIIFALADNWMRQVFEVIDELHPSRGGARDMLSYLGTQIDQMVETYKRQPGLSALITMLTSAPTLRDAVRQHDERIAASVASALGFFVPGAPRDRVLATSRSISIIAHEMLSEAIVRKAPDGPLLIENLKICAFALASRLPLA